MARTNYYPQPRIVVEQSPWQSFFESLPDMLLSFHQMNLRAEEKEADRLHEQSQLYLRDKLDTRNMLRKSVLDATNDARDRGLTVNAGLDAIFGKDATDASKKVSSDFGDMLAFDVNNLSESLAEINEDIRLADLGARDAFAIDTDFDSFLSPTEIEAYQKASPEILNALDIEQLPESYLTGAQHHLTKPKVREYQAKRAKINNTEKTLNALSNLPEFKGNVDLQAAMVRFQHDPSSSKVHDLIDDAIKSQPDAVEAFKKRIETTDITFRNHIEQLGSLGKGVDKDFFKGLKILGTEDFKAKSLTDPAFVSTFKRDLGENFAIWFSGKTREGKSSGSGPSGEMKKIFKKHGGWDDINNSVPKTISELREKGYLSDRGEFKDLFGWPGGGAKEEAANNFFLKAVDIYEDVDDIEGATGYSSRLMGLLGDPRGDASGVKDGAPKKKAPEKRKVAGKDKEAAVVEEPVARDDFFFPSIPALASERGGYDISRDFNTLNYIYENPDAPAELRGEAGAALNLITQEAQRNESVETLEALAFDSKTDPVIIKSALTVLDTLQNESQLEYLVEAITHSNNIRKAFRGSPPIADIIDEWQSEGSPDVGDWLDGAFPMIEPELIK